MAADNAFRQALRARAPLMGLWANLDGLTATEILATAPGLDFVAIDCEHTPRSAAQVQAQLRVIGGACGRAAVVRAPGHDPVALAALLDVGAQNLLVPHVDTPAQAQAVVRALRYPPHGTRGYASGQRASGYGRDAQYAANAQDRLCLIAMVETRQGLAHVDAIARTDGVDAIYLGAADLACDMGRPAQPAHPEVKAAVGAAIAAAVAAGCAAGVSVAGRALRDEYAAAGASFFAIGQDVLLFTRAIDQQLAEMRA